MFRGPVKGRIGRVTGTGTDVAYVVMDGSTEQVKLKPTDAINMYAYIICCHVYMEMT